MSLESHTIRVLLEARDSGYSEKLRKASEETKKLSLATKAANGDLNGIASGFSKAGAAGVAMLGVVGAKAESFNKSMANVNAALYGSAEDTVESLNAIRKAALESGAAFGYSAKDSADAANELIRAGRSASDVVGGELRSSLAMAAADNMELAEATSIMASAMTQFSKQGVTAAQVSDTLAAGAGVAQGGIGELGEALKYAGTQASASGVSFEETVGLLATLANAGIMGSMAGTGLAGVMRNLQTPTASAKTALEELGVAAYDSEGNFKGVTATIEELSASLDGMTQEQRTDYLSKIFDVRSLNTVLPLLDAAATKTENGTSALRDMQAQVSQSGYAAEQAARQMDTLGGDVKKLGGELEQAFIGSSDGITAFARGAVRHLTDVVDAYNDLPSGAKNAITGLGAVAAGGALAVAGLIKGAETVKRFSSALELMGVKATTASNISKIALGGLGGALAIAGAAFSIYATRAADAKARTEAYSAAIEGAEDATERAAAAAKIAAEAFITGDNADWGWFQKTRTGFDSVAEGLEHYGFTAAQAGKAVAGTQAEFDAFIELLNTKINPEGITGGMEATRASEFTIKLKQQREALSGAIEESERLDAANDELSGSQGEAADAAAEAAAALEAEAEAAQQAAADFDALVDSLFGVRDATSQMLGTRAGFEAAIDSAKEAIDAETAALLKNKDIYDLNDPAIRNAEAGLRAIADAATQSAKTLLDNGGAQETATAQMELAAASIMEQGEAWGLNREELVKYAAEVTGLPEARVSELTVDGTRGALAEVEALTKKLEGLPPEVQTAIMALNASGAVGDVATFRAAVEALPEDKRTEFISVFDAEGLTKAMSSLDGVPVEIKSYIRSLFDPDGTTKAFEAIQAIPASKNTTITADGSQVRGEAAAVQGYLAGIKSKSITITATEIRVAGSAGPRAVPAMHATGGAVHGPGTATSDSIPALLSNGEHVLTAAEVSGMGGHDAVYRMRALAKTGALRFASGGAVRYGDYTLGEWERLVKSPLELNQLKLRIQSLQKEINDPEARKKKTSLERTVDNQQLAELKKELRDSERANWLNNRKSISRRIDDAERAQEKAEDKRRAEEDAKKAATAKKESRGVAVRDLRAQRSYGSSLRDYDSYVLSSYDDSLFSSKEGGALRKSLGAYESQIVALNQALEDNAERVDDLRATYDSAYSSLSRYSLEVAGEWKTNVDAKGNVRSTFERPSAATLAAGATAQAGKVKSLAERVKRLRLKGAGTGLISQIVGLPIDDALATADLFLADSGAIGSMNAALEDLDIYARRGAQEVTESMSVGGLAAAEAFALELEAKSEGIGLAMANAFSKALGGGALPARATGGPVSAFSPYLVGERGPEVFVPASSGNIAPNHALGGTVNNYSVNGVTITPASDEEARTLVDFINMASRFTRAGVR